MLFYIVRGVQSRKPTCTRLFYIPLAKLCKIGKVFNKVW